MKPAPSETAEFLHRVRQQLILAQVRIMELEDLRDELIPKLAAAESQRSAAQTLADQKIDEAGHLDTTLAELQAQYAHMRHMQHITNEALEQTRRHLAAADAERATAIGRAATAEQHVNQLQQEIESLNRQCDQLNARLGGLARELTEAKSTAVDRGERLRVLDGEARAMKVSRSWRWTAWLRAIERRLGHREA